MKLNGFFFCFSSSSVILNTFFTKSSIFLLLTRYKNLSRSVRQSQRRDGRAHTRAQARALGFGLHIVPEKLVHFIKSNRNYIFTFSSLSKSPFQRRNEREIHLIYFILSIYNIYLFLYNTLFFILYGYRFLLWGSDVIHVKQRFPLMHLSRDVRNIFILTLTL